MGALIEGLFAPQPGNGRPCCSRNARAVKPPVAPDQTRRLTKACFKLLKDLSIDAIGPASAEETAATDRSKALKQKVLKRAEQIRRAWKDVPQASATKPDHTGEPDETGAIEDEETREAA